MKIPIDRRITNLEFLRNGGEMGQRVREFDWSNTPVGLPHTWPQALQTSVSIILHSKFPMFLFWGENHICFYNDAYRPSLGNEGKHPDALGQPGKEVWPEIWDIIGPQIEEILKGGEGTWHEDQLVPIYRNGKIEDVYWTYSYSPVYGTHGIDGVFVTCMETTRQIADRKKIQKSENYLQRLFKQAPTPILLLQGSDFIVEICNEQALGLLDKREDEVLGKRYIDIYPEAQDLGLMKLLQQVYATAVEHVQEEMPVYSIRGNKKVDWWARFVFAPIRDEAGDVTSIMITGDDISPQVMARRKIEESEKKYRTLFTSMDQGFCIIELILDGKNKPVDYTFLETNPVFEKHSGLQNAVGKTVRTLVPGPEDSWLQLYGDVARTGQPARVTEFSKALSRWFEVYAFPSGEPAGRKVAVLFTDITDRKKAQEELKDSKDLLQTVYDSAPNGIAVMQTEYDNKGNPEDFTILMFNEYTLNWIGEREYKGRRYADVFPTAKETGILERFKRVAKTGQTATFEQWYPGEGMHCWFRFIAVKKGRLLVVTTEDITLQKQAQNLIRESEQRFQDLVRESSAAIIVLTGPEMRVEIVNHAYGRLVGQEPGELIGRPLFDVIPDYKAEYLPLLEKVRQTGEPLFLYDSPYSVKKGNELISGFVNTVYQPYRNTEGGILGVMAILQDVTEQVHAKRKLEESVSLFRLMADAIPEVIWVADQHGRSEFFNKRWEEFCGVPFKRSTAADVAARFLHPEDGPRVMAAFTEAIRTGRPMEVEQRNLSASGEYRWFLNRARPYRDPVTGEIIKWFGLGIDIHDRKLAVEALKHSETQFRDFSNNIQNLAWMANGDGVVYWYNQRWYDYTGTTPDDMKTLRWEKIIHPDHLKRVQSFLNEAVRKPEPFELTFPMADKRGIYRWFLTSGVPVIGEHGSIIRWIGTNTDINEQIELSEKLEDLVKERTRELYRSNEDLQQFAHVASHDLKEPVRKIRTFVDLLSSEIKNSQYVNTARYLSKIEASVDRMYAMIDGVLLYSSFNGNDNKNLKAVDLNNIIEDIKSDLELIIRQKGAVIEKENLPVIIGSEVSIHQLFYNLVNNALKFSRTDPKPVITITTNIPAPIGPDQSANTKLPFAEITVHDNGIGFDQTYASTIFKTFTRLNSKDRFEGTGLGLALCKKIVERHGGTIRAEGKENEGAKFIFTLPMKNQTLSSSL